jgi:microcystin-dependent protein
MSEPFVGEVKMFAGNFAPRNYAFCDGQLLAVSQNDALFSLLGTTYGGDGRTTFGLPDLRGRIGIHAGQGPGLSSRPLGQKSGAENTTVQSNQVALHSHAWNATNSAAGDTAPAAHTTATATGTNLYGNANPTAMNSQAIVEDAGGGQSHKNVMPFVCINFIVALTGTYPSRS